MRLEEAGAFEVAAPPAAVIDYLADASSLVDCLPGEVSNRERRDDGGLDLELVASHAGASVAVHVRCSVDEVDPATGRVSYSGHGLGSRMKVDLVGEFEIEETAAGTRIEWRGVADVGGLLSSLNRAPAEVAVRTKLAETADNVRVALDAAE